MNDSTVLYWRNGSGYEPAATLDGYSLMIFDWAHAAAHWINDKRPMDSGAVLAEQCRRAKTEHPAAKCVVYRNTVRLATLIHGFGEKSQPLKQTCMRRSRQ